MESLNIGKTLIDLRKRKKWTQQDLADKIGVKRATVTSWELNKSFPPAENLIKVAKTFGVTTDFLLGIEQEKTTNPVEYQANETGEGYLTKDQMIAKLINEMEYKSKQLQKCEEELDRFKNGRTPVFGK